MSLAEKFRESSAAQPNGRTADDAADDNDDNDAEEDDDDNDAEEEDDDEEEEEEEETGDNDSVWSAFCELDKPHFVWVQCLCERPAWEHGRFG